MRWVASSHRTVKAVWTMLMLIFKMQAKTKNAVEMRGSCSRVRQDPGTNSPDETLSSGECVKNMGLMLDTLEELKDLSESLQARDISLSRATHLVEREVDVFLARQLSPGPH